MSYSKDYSALLDLFIRLVNSQAGKEIKFGDEWLNDAQTLSIKLFQHLVSMQTIASGSTIKQYNATTVSFVDHSSIKVIARAALETYLVFFYLYGSTDRAISKFRHKTWCLGGLIDRQSSHISTDEHRKVLISERRQIDELKCEIKESTQFQLYPLKHQTKLLEGKWRIGNDWSELGVQAGFHKKYFKNIYGYLCGYSHSSYISALQVGQAQSIKDQKMLAKTILDIGTVIMAHFAFSYSRAFNSANEVLSSNTDVKRIAEKWYFGEKDMAAIYDR